MRVLARIRLATLIMMLVCTENLDTGVVVMKSAEDGA